MGSIKGLTVEIGGDTTKLGKALENVNQKSKGLSSELGQINRLLKLDPGNADLLAQKQQVLADAVANTRAKLDTLKAASEQAAKSAENYDAWKAKYDPLQAEIDQVTQKLKELKARQAEIADSEGVESDAYQALQAEIDETAKSLTTLKKQAKAVNEEFGSPASPEQIRTLQREVVATEQKLKGYEDAAEETAQAVEQLGQGSSEASDGVEETGKEAKPAADKVEDFAKAADKAETSTKGLGTAAVAAGTFFGNLASKVLSACVDGLRNAIETSREYRTEMGKLDAAYTSSGHSADTAATAYSSLYGVIGETDQSVEAAQQIALLADSEKDVAQWSDLAAGVVGKFGDALQPETFYESANETLKLGEATGAYTQMLEGCGYSVEDFNKGLAACKTEQEKQAYMLSITESLLGSAGEAYRKNNEELIRANQANDAWMQSLAGIGGAIEPIITDVKMLGAEMVADLVPGVQQLAESFRGLLSGDMGAAAGVGEALSGIITGILQKVTTMAPMLATAAVSLITSLTTTLISMLPQIITAGVQVIMALISGLTTAIPQVIQAIVTMIPQLTQALVTGIPQLIQGAVQLFLALVQALPQIIPPLTAAIPQLVTSIVGALLTAMPQLIQGAIQFFMAIIQALPVVIGQLAPQIPTIVNTIVTGLISQIPLLIQGAIQLFNALVQALPIVLGQLLPQLPLIIQSVVNTLVANIPMLLQGAVQLFMALVQAIPTIVSALIAALPSILQAIQSGLSGIVSIIGTILANVLPVVGGWISNMVGKAIQLGSSFISSVVSFFSQLPGQISTWLSNVIANVSAWAGDLAAKGKAAAQNLVKSVTNGVKNLPGEMLAIGKNIVQGIGNGISGATSWLIGKIQSLCSSAKDAIKSFFGIASPSKVMAEEVGRWIPPGIGEGITQNAKAAINAVTGLSNDIMDAATTDVGGLAFERNLANSGRGGSVYSPGVAAFGADYAAVLDKLDGIYERLGRLQVVLDSGATVGGLIDDIDAALATKQVLAARGV